MKPLARVAMNFTLLTACIFTIGYVLFSVGRMSRNDELSRLVSEKSKLEFEVRIQKKLLEECGWTVP